MRDLAVLNVERNLPSLDVGSAPEVGKIVRRILRPPTARSAARS
jgi:hypothetical protein